MHPTPPCPASSPLELRVFGVPVAVVHGRETRIPLKRAAALLAKVQHSDWEGGLLGDKANCALFDTAKIKRLVPGFTCPTRFDQAARLSLDHILSHPELQKEDPAFDAFCEEAARVMAGAGEAFASMKL